MTQNFRNTPRLLTLAMALMLSLSATALAQETNSNISGTVRDAAGAAVKGATVTITDVGQQLVVRTMTTNDDGEFSAANLPATTYDVSVEAPGFKKHNETKVKLDVGKSRTLDIGLEAGNISEVVTVEAVPLTVQLTTATAATVISGDQVRELSLNNRNWVQLVALAPGVSNDLSDQVYVGTTNPAGQANTINI